MPNPFEEPFAKHKPRKPGVAPLVGEFFGPGAQKALEKEIGEKAGKPMPEAPPEDWEGVDIEMSAAEKAGMQIERDHVRLQNIPTFTKLPDADTIKQDFNFSLLGREYRKDRPVTDFALTESDLERIGLDKHIQSRLQEAMASAKETPPLAKVFDIGEIIRQKRQADPKHPDTLSTKEVLEAIDAAGYRPATLQELLAYGRDHWKPDVDSSDLTEDEQERLHLANASFIYALGTPFSDSGRRRRVPFLFGRGPVRDLDMEDFGLDWNSGLRFLVLRKESS